MLNRAALIAIFFLLGLSLPVNSQEMRQIKRVRTPASLAKEIPEGAMAVSQEKLKPVPAGEVSGAVKDLARAWNTPAVGEKISESYFDKSRFNDATATELPWNARLTLQSVRAMQTVNQVIVPNKDGTMSRISTVSVIADTQIELNDSVEGFVRVPGTNEIIFDVIEKVE